jgi:hypothetical protein
MRLSQCFVKIYELMERKRVFHKNYKLSVVSYIRKTYTKQTRASTLFKNL